ncbi:MAG: AAA family ATPase [Acidobacteriota bacterium]
MRHFRATAFAGLALLLGLGLPGTLEAQTPNAADISKLGLQVRSVRPITAPPTARVTVEISLSSALSRETLGVRFGGRQAEIKNVQAVGENLYDLEVEVPRLGPGPVALRVVQPPFKEAVAPQLFTIPEPLRIEEVSPRTAAPGEQVDIRIPVRDPSVDSELRVSFDRREALPDSRSPGLLRVKVPDDFLETGWKLDLPFSRMKRPALRVYSGQEEAIDGTGRLVVREPLLTLGQLLSVIWLVILLLVVGTAALFFLRPESVWVRRLRRALARPSHTEPDEAEKEPLPPPVPPDGLVADCLAGDCIAYVGAGLSAASGYPEWRHLVSEILEWAIEKEYVEHEFGEALRATLQEGNADLVADSVIGRLAGREERLHRHLAQIFLDSERPLSGAHRLLRELHLGAALTTNFDELLERAFERERPPVFTPEDTDRLLEALASRSFFLLKLYGSPRKPSTLLLSPAQYQEAIAGNRAFVQAMESLFFSRTILFVGASLAGIEGYLGGLAFRGIARRRHYALVGVTGNAWQARADLLSRRYGIQVIPYRPSTPSHPEVVDFLSGLRDRVRAESRPGARRRGPELLIPRANPLTRVRLENVGPFHELDLKLDPRWTLLLGDNGVGKSTVLEAVAAAICGKDAEPWAGRLIHTSSRVARIVLSFGANEYMASLISRENGQAEIEVTPSRPLETEGWLAIGFPPLRMVSWSRSKGPGPEGKRRPTTDDLLPLLKGTADPRIDEIKQWLVNLDYWSKSEPPGDGNRYSRLRDEFFRLAYDLTEGVKLRFKRVDEFTHQVTVETEDGEVPIEAVSQGTASVIGWTGYLLQRLHEVYGQQDGDPRRRYALVLLDELDAHMHPSWQQSMVERLSEAFPGVQFVASSHSPLIAGSLPASSIIRFRREDGKVVAHQPESSFKGWRVDQILTSPLFGLQTGRESETERMLMRYTELAARDHLDGDEQEEMRRTAEALRVRLPTPVERQEARAAYEVLEAAMRDRLREMNPVERDKILSEAKVQLQEAMTGSRRPD